MNIKYETDFNNLKNYMYLGKTSLIIEKDQNIDEIDNYFSINKIEYRKYTLEDNLYEAVEGVKNVIVYGSIKTLKKIDVYPLDYIFIPSDLFMLDVYSLISPPRCIVFMQKYETSLYCDIYSQLALLLLEYNDISINYTNPIESYVLAMQAHQDESQKYDLVVKYFSSICEDIKKDLFVLCLMMIIRFYMAVKNINMLTYPGDFDNAIKIMSKMLNIPSFGILKTLSSKKELGKESFKFISSYNIESFKRKYDEVIPLIKAYKNCLKDKGYDMSISFRKIYDYISYAAIFSNQSSDYFQLFLLGLI